MEKPFRLPKSEQQAFYVAEEAIFREYKLRGAKIIPDGAISEESYRAARLKVAVILKEPNDASGEWQAAGNDLRGFGWCGGRSTTWDNLAKWSYLFQYPQASYPEAESAIDQPDIKEQFLRHLVVINLKKVPGSHSASMREVKQHASEYSDLLRRQFSIYKPALTIAGGTHPILVKLLSKEGSLRRSDEFLSYFLDEDLGTVMDFYHPQPRGKQATIHEELYELLKRDVCYHGLD